jgi:hypothetical protein
MEVGTLGKGRGEVKQPFGHEPNDRNDSDLQDHCRELFDI